MGFVSMRVAMGMTAMPLIFRMMMFMIAMLVLLMAMIVIVRQMDIELHALDSRFLGPGNVQMVAVHFQFGEFAVQFAGIGAKVQQCAYQHVAADAAEDV